MPDEPAIALISQYPREHQHVRRSALLAVGIHLLIAALVCLITYWLGIVSLRDLLTKGGSIAESGPAPEVEEVFLVEQELTPPPTPNPEFVQQIVKPKVAPPPVPPKKAVPKPNPVKPHYTAPNAHGQGTTQNLSVARVGSSGLPAPPYPYAAHNAGDEGTVGMEVVFGPDGSVASAEVVQSSGYSILDVSTRNFVYGHWKNAQLANQTIHIPIIYDMTQPTGH
jgi:TonB family protein